MSALHSLAEGEVSVARYVDWARTQSDVLARVLTGVECRAEFLDAGVMNYVWRLHAGSAVYFLKQARPRIRRHDWVGPDLASVSPNRITAEARALTFVQNRLPHLSGERIPRLTWHDALNNVLWTEALGQESRSLQGELETGSFCTESAGWVGELLGTLHSADRGEVPHIWPNRTEDQQNWERFLRMRTVGVLQGAQLPRPVEEMIRNLHADGESAAVSGMLSHLDLAPKNVLLHPDRAPSVLDFELGAACSDPAYDPGFLMGHYVLMGINRDDSPAAAWLAAQRVCQTYLSTAGPQDPHFCNRAWQYAGMVLLYRIHGSSPAPYVRRDRLEAIHKVGIRLVMEAAPWDAVA